MNFEVSSSVGISTNNIILNLDGQTVSGLAFSGSPDLWEVSYPVKTNSYHTAIITMVDDAGVTVYTNNFATYNPSNYQWEAEDYDYGGGQYFDNMIDAYSNLPPVSGVDCYESDANGANGSFGYRPSPAGNLAIPAGSGDLSGELPRAQFTSGGGTGIDFNIGYFGGGSWANYTRHYPAGTYNIVGRFAEGNNPTEATISLVTSGYQTATQTTSLLGTFFIPKTAWTGWEWTPMKDANGNLATVTLDGSQTTLQLAGSPIAGQDEVNVNFLMLVPAVAPANPVALTASSSGGNIVISFLTQSNFNYQVQYKNNLMDSSWTSLGGGAVSGDGTTKSVNDAANGNQRFYRVEITPNE
ncbi:MAG: hypothetical protein ACREFE_12205, partial [Limisphaerales bacterium]